MNKRHHIASITIKAQLALAVAAGILVCAAQAAQACGDASATSSATSQSLATFSYSIESYLWQSSSGRAEIKNAIADVAGCRTSAAAASYRVASVVRNRQSILAQLATLRRPSAQAAQVASLLQSSLSHSIAADLHYVDWLGYLQRSGRYCSVAWNPDLAAAQHEDGMASAAKQSFAYAFNPLAAQLHLQTWSPTAF
jgi:hypothetical protein